MQGRKMECRYLRKTSPISEDLPYYKYPAPTPVTCMKYYKVIGSGTELELAVNTSLTLETHVTTFEGILRYTYIS
jgi:hypothetical protein